MRRLASVLVGLVGLLVVAAGILYFLGTSRLGRIHSVQVAALAVTPDSTSIDRGRHLAGSVALCNACHGENLEGGLLFEAPGIAAVYAPNLTSGRGGRGAVFDDVDFVRAIRHGVAREGRGLLIMHSDAYNHLGENDLAAIIAYLKSAAPVDNVLPESRTSLLGRVMVALGLFDMETVPLIPAEVIDHTAPFRNPPVPGATAEYGEYLVSLAICGMCHGPDLRGAPPIEEGAPPGPSLAGYGAVGGWSEDQFIQTIRSGTTPYGAALDPAFMPWGYYAGMTDDELRAIARYLASINQP